MKFCIEGNRLIGRSGAETLWIEPWGENSLRVRMTKEAAMDPNDWALTDIPRETSLRREAGSRPCSPAGRSKVNTASTGRLTAA